MKSHVSKLAIIVIAVLLIVAGLVGNKRNASVNTTQNTGEAPRQQKERRNTIEASQRIVVQEDSTTSFTTHTIEQGSTALDLLYNTTTATAKGTGKDAFVVMIGDVAAEEEKKQFWAFYVNGKPADVGAGAYKLKNGDKIEWKLENY